MQEEGTSIGFCYRAEPQSANKPEFEAYSDTFDSITSLGGAEIRIAITHKA